MPRSYLDRKNAGIKSILGCPNFSGIHNLTSSIKKENFVFTVVAAADLRD
jgi:hypothetical protein